MASTSGTPGTTGPAALPRASVRLRRRLLGGVTALSALALTACGGGAFGTGDGRTTITYWLWDANQQPAYQQCAEDFENSQSEYRIDVQQHGWEDYWTQLALGFVSDSAPDVFTNHLSKYPEYVTRDLLMPLDDLVERDHLPLDIYEEGLTELWTGEDGARYGLPKDWDAVGLFYNEDMLREAGLDPAQLQNLTWNPEDGGTYEDVIARLTVDENGVRGDEPGFDKHHVRTYGLWMQGAGGDGFGQAQWSMYAVSNGFQYTDTNPWGTHFNFDQPAFQETMTWWQHLIEEGYSPAFAVQDGQQSADQMAAGNAAMAMDGSWMTGTFTGIEGIRVGIAPTPIGPSGERASMSNSLADSIFAGTDHPEGAWEWVKYLASPACQRVVGEYHVVFPAITEAWHVAQQKFAEEGIDVSPFTDQVEQGTTFRFPITEHAGEISALLIPAFEAVMSGAPVDSLDEVNEEINGLFEED
ncbi:ABC transporter substrate-binding protein [Streptomyces hoynatensis]|uniref:Sugar ABC transporter substrate-binding protein n=1 Tax=Streptomyces hoynatensis TaxID=1141874 RepID=A0A3A9YVC5_9ACTN|nr:sugar ABC transporter substrate-binding protein [Streptomyces hoynatensis]RKN39187.1 sugar ABC transporter substrate-binding protein [Streptomyces hoynatensis]